jgi:hypothetical protein
LPTSHALFLVIFMVKDVHHRHGENIKKIAQVPERPVSAGAPDILPPAKTRPPEEIKHIRRQVERDRLRKPANQAQK